MYAGWTPPPNFPKFHSHDGLVDPVTGELTISPADEAYILESECTCQQYFSNGEIVEVVCQNCKKLDGTDDELPF